MFCVQCFVLGGLASVAGGCRKEGAWSWLTGRRVAQDGGTPLHLAALFDQEAAITTLLAANADIHVTDNVIWRGGGSGFGLSEPLGEITDQERLEVDHASGTGAGCSQGARRVCVPGGVGVSVSADTTAAGPQDGRTPLEKAVYHDKTSAAQLLREAAAAKVQRDAEEKVGLLALVLPRVTPESYDNGWAWSADTGAAEERSAACRLVRVLGVVRLRVRGVALMVTGHPNNQHVGRALF